MNHKSESKINYYFFLFQIDYYIDRTLKNQLGESYFHIFVILFILEGSKIKFQNFSCILCLLFFYYVILVDDMNTVTPPVELADASIEISDLNLVTTKQNGSDAPQNGETKRVLINGIEPKALEPNGHGQANITGACNQRLL